MTRPMVVVPQDLLDSLRYNQQQKMGTVGQQLVSLDTEMKDILNADLPDAAKAQKYFQTLQKYMMTKEIATTPKEEKTETPPTSLSPVNDVPLKQRKKAEQIFNWIKRVAPDKITWNNRGEVEGIPGSNIADLITELTKVRSTTLPAGFAQFTELAKEANIPQTLVSNKEHWDTYFNPAPVRDDDIYEETTPRHTSTPYPRRYALMSPAISSPGDTGDTLLHSPGDPTRSDRNLALTLTRTPPPVNVPKKTWHTLER